eukprot:jgi/Undpi1/4285/HiC_scaffold_17.g07651.m1
MELPALEMVFLPFQGAFASPGGGGEEKREEGATLLSVGGRGLMVVGVVVMSVVFCVWGVGVGGSVGAGVGIVVVVTLVLVVVVMVV